MTKQELEKENEVLSQKVVDLEASMARFNNHVALQEHEYQTLQQDRDKLYELSNKVSDLEAEKVELLGIIKQQSKAVLELLKPHTK